MKTFISIILTALKGFALVLTTIAFLCGFGYFMSHAPQWLLTTLGWVCVSTFVGALVFEDRTGKDV